MPGLVRFSANRPSHEVKDLIKAYTRAMKRLVRQVELCYPYAKEAGSQAAFIQPLVEALKKYQKLMKKADGNPMHMAKLAIEIKLAITRCHHLIEKIKASPEWNKVEKLVKRAVEADAKYFAEKAEEKDAKKSGLKPSFKPSPSP